MTPDNIGHSAHLCVGGRPAIQKKKALGTRLLFVHSPPQGPVAETNFFTCWPDDGKRADISTNEVNLLVSF